MHTPPPHEDTIDLELAAQDELGRVIAPKQDSVRDDELSLPDRTPSPRCHSAERELLRHDFRQDC